MCAAFSLLSLERNLMCVTASNKSRVTPYLLRATISTFKVPVSLKLVKQSLCLQTFDYFQDIFNKQRCGLRKGINLWYTVKRSTQRV